MAPRYTYMRGEVGWENWWPVLPFPSAHPRRVPPAVSRTIGGTATWAKNEDRDLGGRADAKGRAPGAGSRRHEQPGIPGQFVQAGVVPMVSPGQKREGKYLAPVGMAG